MNKSLEAIAEYETYIKDTATSRTNIDYEDVEKHYKKTLKRMEKDLLVKMHESYKEQISEINRREITNELDAFTNMINITTYVAYTQKAYREHVTLRNNLMAINEAAGIKKPPENKSYRLIESHFEAANNNLLVGMGLKREEHPSEVMERAMKREAENYNLKIE